jgi:hypothetical protein
MAMAMALKLGALASEYPCVVFEQGLAERHRGTLRHATTARSLFLPFASW